LCGIPILLLLYTPALHHMLMLHCLLPVPLSPLHNPILFSSSVCIRVVVLIARVQPLPFSRPVSQTPDRGVRIETRPQGSGGDTHGCCEPGNPGISPHSHLVA